MNDSEARLDRLIAAVKRHDHPAAAETARAWASLEAAMIAGAGPSVPLELGTTTSGAGGLGLKSLVVVGVTVITAATTAIVAGAIESRDRDAIVRPAHAPEARAPARSDDAVPEPAMLPAVLAPSVAAPPTIAPTAEPSATPRRAAPSVEADDPPPSDDAPASTLAEQARLLGDAWRDLNAGDTAAALARLQEHARRFPQSPLLREREAARIVAWCGERKPWAAAQARRFLADHEGGTLAERVERACDVASKIP